MMADHNPSYGKAFPKILNEINCHIQVTKQLAQFTTIDVALSVGGLDLRLQEAALRKNPDIVIATPGRYCYFNILTFVVTNCKENVFYNSYWIIGCQYCIDV